MCRTNKVGISYIKFTFPDIYYQVLKKTKYIAIKEIIEMVKNQNIQIWSHLQKIIKEINKKYSLNWYNDPVIYENLRYKDQELFDSIFEPYRIEAIDHVIKICKEQDIREITTLDKVIKKIKRKYKLITVTFKDICDRNEEWYRQNFEIEINNCDHVPVSLGNSNFRDDTAFVLTHCVKCGITLKRE